MNDAPKNRIAELRNKSGLTLKKLGKFVGMRDSTISQYETGKREPKRDVWYQLADFFKVPVDYLEGYSNDKVGWHWWEERTGYSRSIIEAQIEELTNIGVISKEDELQSKIEIAVTYLNDEGRTNKTAVMSAYYGIRDLKMDIKDKFFVDNAKVEQAKKEQGTKFLSGVQQNNGSLYYDNMDKEVYSEISKVLRTAQDSLEQIVKDKDLK